MNPVSLPPAGSLVAGLQAQVEVAESTSALLQPDAAADAAVEAGSTLPLLAAVAGAATQAGRTALVQLGTVALGEQGAPAATAAKARAAEQGATAQASRRLEAGGPMPNLAETAGGHSTLDRFAPPQMRMPTPEVHEPAPPAPASAEAAASAMPTSTAVATPHAVVHAGPLPPTWIIPPDTPPKFHGVSRREEEGRDGRRGSSLDDEEADEDDDAAATLEPGEAADLPQPDAEHFRRVRAALLPFAQGELKDLMAELERGRTVVVATPVVALAAGEHGPVPACIDVLRSHDGKGYARRLKGELRLMPAAAGSRWIGAHLIKSQSDDDRLCFEPVVDDADSRRVAVILMPHAGQALACSHAQLLVPAGAQLWQSLEPQWTFLLAIGTRPLAGTARATDAH